jgi:hypothetical protein
MELTVLTVPECPTAAVLRERLAVVLHGRTSQLLGFHQSAAGTSRREGGGFGTECAADVSRR